MCLTALNVKKVSCNRWHAVSWEHQKGNHAVQERSEAPASRNFLWNILFLSNFLIRSLSLSIIWWQLWITACIKTFGRLWIQETMYLSLSEQTTYFFLLFLSLQLAFVRPNSLPSGNPAQEPWATENSLQQKVFLPITETWDETTGTSITLRDKDFFYHYSH